MATLSEKISQISKKISPKKVLFTAGLVVAVGIGAHQVLERKNEVISEKFDENTSVTFLKEWNFRKIVAEWTSLESVHRAASNGFAKHLEDDFKGIFDFNSVDGKSFHSSVRKQDDGKYRMTYTINIVPKNPISAMAWKENIISIVDMRGAVIEGKNAEISVDNINKKRIPEWQAKMGKYSQENDAKMQYLRTEHKEGNLYLEAYLGLGVKNVEK